MELLSNLGEQLRDTWSEWPRAKRISLLLSAALTVAAFATLMTWGTRETYATLLTGLSPQDASAITERLGADGIPYELAAGGTSIRVAAPRVHELRLRLAGDGLPRGGGVGFEMFDEPSFGVSRFAEQLNYRRGLEGELRRTIRSLDPVREARIHIVVPKKSLFRDQRAAATASVSLQLEPGRQMSAGQVQSVVHLVASSVEGLAPDKVTVVDTSGAILSRAETGAVGQLGAELEHQRTIERDVEQRVKQMLGRVVGAERVTVQVNARLDFTRSEKTVESYDPDSIAMRSEKSTEEDRGAASGGGTSGTGFGLPGARSNLAGKDGATARSGSSSSKRSQTRSYEVSKDIKHEQSGTHRIDRLSVAVLVDGTYREGADGARVFEALPEEQLESLTALAKTAVGFDAVRGDKLVVQSMQLETTDLVEAPVQAAWVEMVESTWRPAVAVVLIVFLGLVLLLSRRAAGKAIVLDKPRTVRELEASLGHSPALAGAQGAMALGGLDAPPALMPPPPEPAKAAAVLKTWLGDDSE